MCESVLVPYDFSRPGLSKIKLKELPVGRYQDKFCNSIIQTFYKIRSGIRIRNVENKSAVIRLEIEYFPTHNNDCYKELLVQALSVS
jgi:hypothetical protein